MAAANGQQQQQQQQTSLLTPAFPAVSSQQRVSNSSGERKKVALKPGRSLMDWIRLGHSGKDLTGVRGRVMEVTADELAKHNKQDDCWMVIKGCVYNVTAYMEYHPGGADELMRGAGQDATQLFDEVHKWVNAESMLSKCYIGKLKTTPVRTGLRKQESSGSLSSMKLSVPNGIAASASLGFATPAPPPKLTVAATRQPPKYDWLQNEETVTIIFYTKWEHMKHENVIIRRKNTILCITMYIEENTYQFKMDLENDVSLNYQVKVGKPKGKTEVVLTKASSAQWLNLGKPIDGHNTIRKTVDMESEFVECTVDSVVSVTHDTNLYKLVLPPGMRMCVPLGYHVHIKATVNGMDIVRSYTVAAESLLDGSDVEEEGHALYLMIKIYPDGALTSAVSKLKSDDKVLVSLYDGNLRSSLLTESSHIVMCAAGTGFTPMIRLIKHTTKMYKSIRLMFYNKQEKDILWREQLDALQSENAEFSVTHVLSQPSDGWTGLTGRIRKDILEAFVSSVRDDGNVLFCACGPTPFTKEAIRLAEEIGLAKEKIHAFIG